VRKTPKIQFFGVFSSVSEDLCLFELGCAQNRDQQRAPPARVLQLPEVDQSTRPPESAGTKTKVSAFSPEVVCAVPVMTPDALYETEAAYLVDGEHPVLAAPTHGRFASVETEAPTPAE